MSTELNQTTVFRSADDSAEEDAGAVRELLQEAGLNPQLLTDEDPGVPIGAVEVRVPVSQEAQAEQALDAADRVTGEPEDDSHDFDLVPIYEGVGTGGEVEALSIRALLDANGIPSVMMSGAQYPNLPFVVRVPQEMRARAEAVIDEARQSGPEAAEEAEQATEE